MEEQQNNKTQSDNWQESTFMEATQPTKKKNWFFIYLIIWYIELFNDISTRTYFESKIRSSNIHENLFSVSRWGFSNKQSICYSHGIVSIATFHLQIGLKETNLHALAANREVSSWQACLFQTFLQTESSLTLGGNSQIIHLPFTY